MSVMITGASGFIGLNLAEALLRRGEEVFLLSRRKIETDSSTGQSSALRVAGQVLSSLPGTMHSISIDVCDAEKVARVIADCHPDVIVHGAAFTPGITREQADAQAALQVNIVGTLNMLEAARHQPPRRFVVIGSGAVYGANSLSVPNLDENVIPIPNRVYSISKYAAERLSLRWREIFQLDLAVVRVGTVFGPWEWSTGIRETLSTPYQMMRLAVRSEPAILPVEGRRDWTYSRDIADSIIRLIDSSTLHHEVYNIGFEGEWTLPEWGAKLAKAFPGFTYRLAVSGEEANTTFGAPPRSPLDTQLFAEDFGFRARYGLDDAAEDYVRWARENPLFWEV